MRGSRGREAGGGRLLSACKLGELLVAAKLAIVERRDTQDAGEKAESQPPVTSLAKSRVALIEVDGLSCRKRQTDAISRRGTDSTWTGR